MKPFWLSCLLLLLLGGVFLGFSGSVDDAHITYWAAWILAERGEILNYNLERIEQSSALLQVMVLGVLRALTGLDVVVLGHVTTVIVALLTLLHVARMQQGGDRWASLLFLASSPYYVYWSFGGMEGPWLGFLLLLAATTWRRYLCKGDGWLSVLLASLGMQLMRPEMLPASVAMAAGLLLLAAIYRDRFPWDMRRLVWLLLLQLVIAAGILCFRLYYFGDAWPQPVAAKTGAHWLANLLLGLQYAWQSITHPGLCVPVILAAAGWVLAFRRSVSATVLPVMGLFAMVYCGFVVVSGGDWMAAGRFWVPVIPLFAVMLGPVFSLPGLQPARLIVLLLVLAGHVLYCWHATRMEWNGIPLWKQTRLEAADQPERYSLFERQGREHLHDIPTLAFLLPFVGEIMSGPPLGRPVSIMAGQAGMVMYYLGQGWAGRVHIVDRNGLVDRVLTDCLVAAALPRTRHGLGLGYDWLVAHQETLARECGLVMPDMVFDIDAVWNRHNLKALEAAGYQVVYYQKGHIFHESGWLPLRRIGAGQYVAVSGALYQALGSPVPIKRNFGLPPP